MGLDTLKRRIARKQVRRGPSECWPWLGYIHPDGEARIWVDDTIGSIPVARAFFLARGETIPYDKEVLTCPILRECSNPDHVSLATRDEVADRIMWSKGLHRRPSARNKRRPLSDEQIRQIFLSTEAAATVADQYNVTEGQVSNIRAGRRYKSITEPLRLSLEATRQRESQSNAQSDEEPESVGAR